MTARNLLAAALMVALIAVLVLLTGCGGGDPEPEEGGHVTLTDPREYRDPPALVPPPVLPTCDPLFKVCR